MILQSHNPSTTELIGSIEETSEANVTKKVQAARMALNDWRELGIAGRVKALQKVLENFTKKEKQFADLISQEMGMPISQSVHDVSGALTYFRWYLENAERYLSPEITYQDEQMIHTVHFEPVGVVAVITPWNFPASNFIWMAGQTLLAGNTVVFKDSEEVPLCGKLIEEVFEESNLPTGVFAEIYGTGKIGDFLVHQDIDMICFTGSTVTGKHLYQVGAQKFIKVFLELGGSAPGIVCADADIDNVIDTIYANRFDNCGQICDGLKRLIVHESKLDEVITKLKSKLESVVVGISTDPQTEIGPLVSAKQLQILKEQVLDAELHGVKKAFVKVIPPTLKGHFYPPTILTKITKEMKVWKEEVFGPVLPIITFQTEAEAIELANDTQYGLGGYIFTQSKSTFLTMASQIQSGMIQMNNAGYVQPPTPFGGCKTSGIGREHGRFGFQEVTNIKVIATEK